MADNVKANKMNSQADDDIGFGIYTDIADLPMTGCPSYIEEGIGGIVEYIWYKQLINNNEAGNTYEKTIIF